MSDAPALSHSDVRNWTEQHFFDRGENYFQQGRIQRPRRPRRVPESRLVRDVTPEHRPYL